MISLVNIEHALYDWAASILPGIPVIYYHENAPRPTVPYVALHLRMIESVKRDYVSGGGNVTGNREFMLYCQGIGSLSMEYLEKLKTSLSRPAVLDTLREKGIVFVDRLAISSISELVDNRWEERNILDLKFRVAQFDTDTSGIIETANIEGRAKHVPADVGIPINITVPPPPNIPIVAFSAKVNLLTVKLTNYTLGQVDTYEIDWGDGSPHTSNPNDTHVYVEYSTTYNITMTASNVSGSDSATKSIQTGEEPITTRFFTFDLLTQKLYMASNLKNWSDCGAIPTGAQRVVYGNDILVCKATPVVNKGIFYSLDYGASWHEAIFPVEAGDTASLGLDFVNGIFFAVTWTWGMDTGWYRICQSVDGVNWTAANKISQYWPLAGNGNTKFFYFKGDYCALARLADHGDPPDQYSFFMKLVAGNWVLTQISLDGHGIPFGISDETVTVSDSYIVVISDYNGTGYSSPDGIVWDMLVESHCVAIRSLGTNFWAWLDFSGYKMSLPYDNTTRIQGSPIFGFLELYKQALIFNSLVYALRIVEDYKIYKSPIPPITPAWTSDSVGILVSSKLKQLT